MGHGANEPSVWALGERWGKSPHWELETWGVGGICCCLHEDGEAAVRIGESGGKVGHPSEYDTLRENSRE